MGQLHDLKLKLDRLIADRSLDPAETMGRLSLKSGVLVSLLHEGSPDDPAKLEKLRKAAKAVLGVEL